MMNRNEFSGFGFKEYLQDSSEPDDSDFMLSTSVPEYAYPAGGKGQVYPRDLTDFERFLLENKRRSSKKIQKQA